MSGTFIRLLDAGLVPHLRSQSLYHGLARARTPRSPDTIVLATPAEPYVCVGFHQDLAHELDLAYCRRRSLPIVRRETGGGAVYLDSDQLFVQWIMAPGSLPPRVEQRFALFARPLVETYRALGIEAAFRPLNDVHVGGRKIVGTGAARIGEAEVLVGNLILDFDTRVAARILRAPSPAFRDHVDRGLGAYMTSMRQELGAPPSPARVAALYVERCAAALGRELWADDLTVRELDEIERVEARLASPEFLHQRGGHKRSGVKIHEDVKVVESVGSVRGARLRVTARLNADRIEELTLEDERSEGVRLAGLEQALRGVALAPEPVELAVHTYHVGLGSGVEADSSAWIETILNLRDKKSET